MDAPGTGAGAPENFSVAMLARVRSLQQTQYQGLQQAQEFMDQGLWEELARKEIEILEQSVNIITHCVDAARSDSARSVMRQLAGDTQGADAPAPGFGSTDMPAPAAPARRKRKSNKLSEELVQAAMANSQRVHDRRMQEAPPSASSSSPPGSRTSTGSMEEMD